MNAARSTSSGTTGALFYLSGAVAAFVLPFAFPPGDSPVYSTAWLAGTDNRAAMLGLAATSLAMATYQLLRGSSPAFPKSGDPARSHDAYAPLPRAAVLLAVIAVLLWTVFWGGAITRSGLRVGESNYFLEQTRNALGIGLPHPMHIYTELEFPYGPLLLDVPVWIYRAARETFSVETAYFSGLALWNCIGIVLTGYFMNRLPLRRSSRLFAVCLATGVAVHPLFGPNYSLTKFMLPVAVLCAAARVQGLYRRDALLCVGLFMAIMVSPELGIGLSAGIATTLATIHYRSQDRRWMLPLLRALCIVAVAYGTFIAAFGWQYFGRLKEASGGALNLVIQPMPYMLVFVAAICVLAPVAVARAFGTRRPATPESYGDQAPLLAGIFALGLGTLPGALGRADPLHVFFYGMPLLLLSIVAADLLRRPMRIAWLVALTVLAMEVQTSNLQMYGRSLRDVLAAAHQGPPPPIDVARLAAITAGAPVSTPALDGIPMASEMELRRAHLLLADRSPGLAELWNPEAERAHVRQLRTSEWALVPISDYRGTEHLPNHREARTIIRDSSTMKHMLRLGGHALQGFPYPERHAPFVVGELTRQELSKNWSQVALFGDLRLLHRTR